MLASTSRQLARRATTTAWTSRSLATATWSNSLTFASPEADFSGYSDNISSTNKEQRFFYSSSSPAAAGVTNPTHYDQHQPEWWSSTLSFASPESDFTAFHNHPQYDDVEKETTTLVDAQWPQASYMVSTPSVHWSHTISFASPESDFTSPETVAQSAHHGITPYPETFAAALRSSLACVVTKSTAPHTIVAVNTAWTDLCGYTAEEVVGKTLGDLIQGPATNQNLAAATVHRAMAEKQSWVDMYLVNYKKDGSSFTNHVSLKEVPLNEDEPTVRFLLGVLEPVERAPLRMIF
jgi:PAS domain S-box-containing protein